MLPVLRAARRLLPWLRVGAFAVVVGAVMLAVGLRRVRAGVLEAGMALGGTLDGLGDVLPRPYVIWLNGQRAYVASATIEGSPSAALDRVEGLCRNEDGGLVSDLAASAKRAGFVPPSPGVALPLPGLLRTESAKGGIVGCLVQSETLGIRGITARLAEVARDGNLAHLGHVRYARARATRSGKTHLVVVWTADAIRPAEAFPAEGDAPGADLAGVGRPEGSRRILAATIEGSPYGVRVYHARNGVPDEVAASFARELEVGGFSRDTLSRTVAAASFRRGVEEVIIHAEPARSGGAVLSIVSMGRAGGVAP